MAGKLTSSKRSAGMAALPDDALVALAHDGERAAVDELYRRHAGAAKRTARAILGSRQEAEDVVADAFLGVLRAIQGGAGPRDNFRAYLLACVRNGCKMTWRAKRPVPRDPLHLDDRSVVFEDPERYVEADIVASAFSSLSPCWQQTLWLTAVEGKGTEEVARQLRRAPTAVPALALRAREAFAEAYLTQHVARADADACRRVAPKLAAYIRDHISGGDRARVEAHLAECTSCADAADGLRDVNSCLRSLTVPIGLGAFTTSGVGAAAGSTTVTTAVSFGVASTGASGAGMGALVAKAAVVALLAGPVVAFEMSHSALSAPTGASASPRAVADSSDGDAPVGARDEPAGSGGTDGGSPPAPPSPTAPPAGAGGGAPILAEIIGGLGQPGSVSTNAGDGSSLSTSLPLPVFLGAVVAADDSTSVVGAGAEALGAGTGLVAVVGPEALAVMGGVALPGGVADASVVANVGPDGIAVVVPSVVGGSVEPVTVPVSLPVAPVVGPLAGGVFEPVLAPTVDLAGALLGQG